MFANKNRDVFKKYVKKDGAVQSAVFLGKFVPEIDDDDYLPFQVLNTVLGGYFGSRLMTEIREKKGYTYGIYSSLFSCREYSAMGVMAQTATEYTEKLIDDCHKEMRKLIDRRISGTELDRVRKFMHGEMLRSVDGIFPVAYQFGYFLRNGFDTSRFSQAWDVVSSVTPDDLRRLAEKHLQPSSFSQVVCGA